MKFLPIMMIVVLASILILPYINLENQFYESVVENIEKKNEMWSDDIRLTYTSGPSTEPSALYDDNGISLVWCDYTNGKSEVYYKRVGVRGNEITAKIRLSRLSIAAVEPSVAVDHNGFSHVVWLEVNGRFLTVLYSKISPSGSPVIGPTVISYIGNRMDDSYHRTRTSPTNILKNRDMSIFSPSVCTDDDGRAYIAWVGMDGSESRIFYSSISPSGKMDEKRILISGENGMSKMPIVKWNGELIITYIQSDEDGERIVLWRSATEKNYDIIGAESIESYSMDVDSHIHLLFSGRYSYSEGIFYVKASPEGNVEFFSELSKWTSLAVSLVVRKNIHMSYLEKCLDERRAEMFSIIYVKCDENFTVLEKKNIVSGREINSPCTAVGERVAVIWSDGRDGAVNSEIYMRVSREYVIKDESVVYVPHTRENGVALLAATAAFTAILSAAAAMKGKKLIIIPAYTRIKKEHMLMNPSRKRIYDYLMQNPGANFTKMMKDLKMRNGVLSYHLHAMEKREMIKAIKDGNTKRYYAVNHIPIREVHAVILESIKSLPGCTIRDIVDMSDIPPVLVKKYIYDLELSGKVYSKKKGRSERFFIYE